MIQRKTALCRVFIFLGLLLLIVTGLAQSAGTSFAAGSRLPTARAKAATGYSLSSSQPVANPKLASLPSDDCPPSDHAPRAQTSRPLPPQNDAKPRLNLEKKKSPRATAPLSGSSSNAPSWYDTSVFMTGKVAVGIILPESNGVVDANTENWTTDRQNCVVQKIQTGLDWWKNHSPAGANLSFVYDLELSIPTDYEPIIHPSTDDGLWISQVMTNMRYNDTNYGEQVYDYVNAIKASNHADWAYAIFVVDSLNDSDGLFADGDFAYVSNLFGPFIVMTYDNDDWGIGDMNWVAAHETGHIFGAADEYYEAGYGGCTNTTDLYGYLGIRNGNCEYNNPSSVPSIMRYLEDALDPYASGQIGWRDSDSDGLPDPRDTIPAFSLPQHSPNPTTETSFSYSGYVFDQPWPHAQCAGGNACYLRDIDINSITSTEYRIDGGAWLNVTPTDGTLDSDVEQISFNTGTLGPRTHNIEARAVNSVGNTSEIWSDIVTTTTYLIYYMPVIGKSFP